MSQLYVFHLLTRLQCWADRASFTRARAFPRPQLASQVSLIACEYGLPSVAGMCLYLALPTTGSQTTQMTEYLNAGGWSLPSPALGGTDAAPAGFKPRVTEEFWPALWSDFLVDDGIAESMAGVGSLREFRSSPPLSAP